MVIWEEEEEGEDEEVTEEGVAEAGVDMGEDGLTLVDTMIMVQEEEGEDMILQRPLQCLAIKVGYLLSHS